MKLLFVLFVALVQVTFCTPGDTFNQAFDPNGEGFTQELFGHAPGISIGVGFDGNGELITTVPGTGTGFRFSGSQTTEEHGSTIHVAEEITFGAPINGIVNHPNGFIYASAGDLGIVKLDPITFQSVALNIPSSGPAGHGITLDPQDTNKIYYAESNSLTIRRWDISLGLDEFFASGETSGLNFNPDGSLLYATPGVRVYDRSGNLVNTYDITGADGIAFHEATNTVFTNDNDGTIHRIDPATGSVTTFASGGFSGSLSAVGVDACLYSGQTTTRFADETVISDGSIVKICPGFAVPIGLQSCNSVSEEIQGDQLRIDNNPASTVDRIEGRFEFFEDEFLESWINRIVETETQLFTTRYKARITNIIEFVDSGIVDSYVDGVDEVVKTSNLNDLQEYWPGWVGNSPDYTSSTSEGTITAHAHVDYNVPCSAQAPNPTNIKVDIDWRNKYERSDTKIAVEVRYTTFETVTATDGGIATNTFYTGDVSPQIVAQFEGVTSVNSEQGPIPVTFSYVNQESSSTQPSYRYFYTIQTTDHSLTFRDFTLTTPK